MIFFNYHIESVWDSVAKIRDGIEPSLEGFGRKMTDAAVMTASELVENAIRYGDSKKGINFEITADERRIQISVSNTIGYLQDYKELKYLIEKINTSDNMHTVFVDRLRTIMEQGNSFMKTQLGLIRIANEGEFELSYKLENELLTVTAKNSKIAENKPKESEHG